MTYDTGPEKPHCILSRRPELCTIRLAQLWWHEIAYQILNNQFPVTNANLGLLRALFGIGVISFVWLNRLLKAKFNGFWCGQRNSVMTVILSLIKVLHGHNFLQRKHLSKLILNFLKNPWANLLYRWYTVGIRKLTTGLRCIKEGLAKTQATRNCWIIGGTCKKTRIAHPEI